MESTGRLVEHGSGYHENLAVRLSQKYDVAFDVAQHLVRNYGTRAPCMKLIHLDPHEAMPKTRFCAWLANTEERGRMTCSSKTAQALKHKTASAARAQWNEQEQVMSTR